MISGSATPEGTLRFSQKSKTNKDNFKLAEGLVLSNVGMGTYLGDADSKTDRLVELAIKKTIQAGMNVIDTAINYRAQKAERSVGRSIKELIAEGIIQRDEIFVSTKNGYVTNDGDIKEEFWQYVNREFVTSGIIKADDISSGYHCMSVPYLEDQLNRSLKNLDFDCIDLLYIHNAMEGQIQDISKQDFLKKLGDVFELYENKRRDGLIKFYGMATWECFRCHIENPQYLSLSETLNIAKKVGGDNHGFKFIQLPFNMYFDQAFMTKNQNVNGNDVSFLEAAKQLKINVFTSVPLMQGRLLAPGVMPEFGSLKPSLRALQFIRSTPGVLAPLVGQKSDDHVNENTEIMKIPPIKEDEFSNLVKQLTS